jgi:predicted dienelactone hydrolase
MPSSSRSGRVVRVAPLIALLLAFGVAHAQAPATYVGFRQIEFPDAVTGQRVPLFVWYPTSQASRPTRFGPYTLDVARGAPPAGGRHRLVMISHGTAGDPLAHAQLGMALARQSYVAAAPSHAKDNSRDWSGVGTYEVWYGRPRQISEGIDALLADPALGTVIDPDRIAVIGHSAGGYTALVLVGGRADMDRARSHCRQHPDDGFCQVRRPDQTRVAAPSARIPDSRDARIKAAIAMAPPGILLDPVSLAKVGVPVRIYAAELDAVVPGRYHAEPLRDAIKPTPEFVLVRGASHFAFVEPFPEAIKQQVGEPATDPPGFDRAGFQERLRREIVEFLDRALR